MQELKQGSTRAEQVRQKNHRTAELNGVTPSETHAKKDHQNAPAGWRGR